MKKKVLKLRTCIWLDVKLKKRLQRIGRRESRSFANAVELYLKRGIGNRGLR